MWGKYGVFSWRNSRFRNLPDATNLKRAIISFDFEFPNAVSFTPFIILAIVNTSTQTLTVCIQTLVPIFVFSHILKIKINNEKPLFRSISHRAFTNGIVTLLTSSRAVIATRTLLKIILLQNFARYKNLCLRDGIIERKNSMFFLNPVSQYKILI